MCNKPANTCRCGDICWFRHDDDSPQNNLAAAAQPLGTAAAPPTPPLTDQFATILTAIQGLQSAAAEQGAAIATLQDAAQDAAHDMDGVDDEQDTVTIITPTPTSSNNTVSRDTSPPLDTTTCLTVCITHSNQHRQHHNYVHRHP